MLNRTEYRNQLVSAIARRERRLRWVRVGALLVISLVGFGSLGLLMQAGISREAGRVATPASPSSDAGGGLVAAFEFMAGESHAVLIGRGGGRGATADSPPAVGPNAVTVTDVRSGKTWVYDGAQLVGDAGSLGTAEVGIPATNLGADGHLPQVFVWAEGILLWQLESSRGSGHPLLTIPIQHGDTGGSGPLNASRAQVVGNARGSGFAQATHSGGALWLLDLDSDGGSRILYRLNVAEGLVEVLRSDSLELVGVAGERAVVVSPESGSEGGEWQLIDGAGTRSPIDPPDGSRFVGGTERHLVWMDPELGARIVIDDQATGERSTVRPPDGRSHWATVSVPTTTTAAGPLPSISPDGRSLVLGFAPPPDGHGRGTEFAIIGLDDGEVRLVDLNVEGVVDSVFWADDETVIAVIGLSEWGRRQALVEIDVATGAERSLGQVVPDGVSIIGVSSVPR